MIAARPLALARAVYGAGLLVAPAAWLGWQAGAPLDRSALTVARLLGARELVQVALIDSRPTRGRLAIGVAVDCAHGASMVAAARWAGSADHRTLAARNARTAAVLAALGGLSLVA